MPFEKFTRIGRGYAPKASIWTRGQIGFNRGAVEKFNINDFDFAVLFFDKDTNRIGIKFTNDSNEEGISKIAKGKTSAFISAKAFVEYNDIPHDKTKKYNIAYSQSDNLYVIDLQAE